MSPEDTQQLRTQVQELSTAQAALTAGQANLTANQAVLTANQGALTAGAAVTQFEVGLVIGGLVAFALGMALGLGVNRSPRA